MNKATHDKLVGELKQEKMDAEGCGDIQEVKACKVLGVEYKEPEFLNWNEGRAYHKALWGNRVFR